MTAFVSVNVTGYGWPPMMKIFPSGNTTPLANERAYVIDGSVATVGGVEGEVMVIRCAEFVAGAFS